MTAYELIKRRDELKETLYHLCSKTNGWAGKDKGLWNSISMVRTEIERIEDLLKTVEVKVD